MIAALMALMLQAPATAATAAPADFSGVWTLDYTRSETMAAGGRIDRGPLVIAHRGDSFTVTSSEAGQRPVAFAVVTSPTQRVAGSTGGSAWWDGASLVTEIDGMVNGKSVVVKQSRTLSPGGQEMVVETILAIQHGYAPGEDLPKSVARDTYVRAAAR